MSRRFSQPSSQDIYLAPVGPSRSKDFAVKLEHRGQSETFRLGAINDPEPDLGRCLIAASNLAVVVFPDVPRPGQNDMSTILGHELTRVQLARQGRPPGLGLDRDIANDAAAYEVSSAIADVCSGGILGRCVDVTLANGGLELMRQGIMLTPDYTAAEYLSQHRAAASALRAMALNTAHDYYGQTQTAPADVIQDYITVSVNRFETEG